MEASKLLKEHTKRLEEITEHNKQVWKRALELRKRHWVIGQHEKMKDGAKFYIPYGSSSGSSGSSHSHNHNHIRSSGRGGNNSRGIGGVEYADIVESKQNQQVEIKIPYDSMVYLETKIVLNKQVKGNNTLELSAILRPEYSQNAKEISELKLLQARNNVYATNVFEYLKSEAQATSKGTIGKGERQISQADVDVLSVPIKVENKVYQLQFHKVRTGFNEQIKQTPPQNGQSSPNSWEKTSADLAMVLSAQLSSKPNNKGGLETVTKSLVALHNITELDSVIRHYYSQFKNITRSKTLFETFYQESTTNQRLPKYYVNVHVLDSINSFLLIIKFDMFTGLFDLSFLYASTPTLLNNTANSSNKNSSVGSVTNITELKSLIHSHFVYLYLSKIASGFNRLLSNYLSESCFNYQLCPVSNHIAFSIISLDLILHMTVDLVSKSRICIHLNASPFTHTSPAPSSSTSSHQVDFDVDDFLPSSSDYLEFWFEDCVAAKLFSVLNLSF
ncbi:hypothetical protein AX774_g4658 [Zancudomyces culisetae]|uniref:Mediator of RNA polymerase II transcription subunit 17 n=1 Tax=Zancudomyces culisetae TaxID=1213189 RepID=A0A1R1PLP4_ZANCU|nr:hypothetical protein AX774_g4658 [Zancudomyces culisetae]|eukprot:OMH81884.1 hypothetical protein AX774_g4658 [Zancudomyces culisetae]